MITQTHQLKSITLSAEDVLSLAGYMHDKYNARGGDNVGWLKFYARTVEGTSVELSADDDGPFIDNLAATFHENVEDLETLKLELYTNKLTVNVSFEARSLLDRAVELRISADKRADMIVAIDTCKRSLNKWKPGRNHLVCNYFINMALSTFTEWALLLRLAYKVSPSSKPLPASTQSLIIFIISLSSVLSGFLVAHLLGKRYPKVIFIDGKKSSGHTIESDWGKTILPAIVIPVILLIIAWIV